jgi:signal transduction histidine kinase
MGMSWVVVPAATAAAVAAGRVVASGVAPVGRPDMIWTDVTVVLSVLVALGYFAVAVNWYFQAKVGSPQARGALRRLLLIPLACAILGAFVYVMDFAWGYLRVCDAGIALLAAYTWWFVLRMSGPSLVDQRLAQVDELERRAETYREIAELLPHLVWTATADGQVDFSNCGWVEYAGGSWPWTQALHDGDRHRVVRWWRESVEKRRAGSIEARLAGADGAYRTFLISATPIISGHAVKWLGACADIEAQKQLAAERERQARQKAFLLNALSHDLRSPLNVVALHAEVLRSCVKPDDEQAVGGGGGQIAESARLITENAVAAGELIGRLLDFARVGSLERNVTERVSLAGVLQQVHRRFQPIAEGKGLFVRLAEGSDLDGLVLSMDRHKVERIVGNLVENAIKYTPRGGITVSALRVEGGQAIAIQVRDTGIGVPHDKAEALFDEFVQLGNDERDRRKGFGLGLAICRALAQQIGGTVRLASTGPQGSCFELRLPVGEEEHAEPSTEPSAGAATGSGLCEV